MDVVRWDDGYLVVLAKYSHNTEPEEEYIDLKPILNDLYIDSTTFLKPIKSVRIAYAWHQEYILNNREISKISDFIKDHYQEMYLRWSQYSDKGYYEKST